MKYHLAAITQDQGGAEQLGESREPDVLEERGAGGLGD